MCNYFTTLNISKTHFAHYFDAVNLASLQNILLFRGILSKLTDAAKEAIAIYVGETWEDVKKERLARQKFTHDRSR